MSLHVTAHQLVETEEHIQFCAYSHDAKRVACALSSGALRILDAITFESLSRGAPGKDFVDVPATCVRWAPAGSQLDWQLVSSSCAGGVMLWALDPGDNSLKRGVIANEDGNEVMAVDVSPSGKAIISAGSDRVVRLYNAELQLLSKLVNGVNPDGSSRSTHTNRIFSVRFLADFLAVSAGWESPVQVWDLRSRCANRQVTGVQGSSDCLEPVTGTHLVLVASPKTVDTLQLFDSVTARVMEANSATTCAQLQSEERVLVCRFCADTGHVWCLAVSPPALIVLALSSGHVVARTALPAPPLSMTQHGSGVVVGCKNGIVLEVTLSM
jgi:WD40 repeat protein